MNAIVKSLTRGLGKQTLQDAVKAGGWKVIIDGSLAQTLVEQGAGGNLVATDQFGNQYYERSDTLSNRHRWVVFANAQDYRGQDPSGIPPEWHGWLHAITDSNPLNHQFVEPIYAVPASLSRTNTPQRHTPKGSWFHPAKRNWAKYQAWGRN